MPVPQMMRVSYQFSEKFMLKRQSERVAQAVEHVTFNHGVVGSSPTALTKSTFVQPAHNTRHFSNQALARIGL